MAIPLTKEQQQALDSAEDSPPEVVDPRTNEAYVLIPAAQYETLREIVEDERQQRIIGRIAFGTAVRRLQEDS